MSQSSVVNRPSCFPGQKDMYGGVTVDLEEGEKCSSDEEFALRIQASLRSWQNRGIRGVWLKVPLKCSSFIPIAVQNQFEFHHAQPKYLMMVRWLPKDEANLLPGYATNYLGVAGFVVNDKNEVLVIQEKYNHFSIPHWKLPGGLADSGEDLAEAAKREVQEETGILSEFVSVLCFRHKHNFYFGQSDFYFVCHMTPVNQDIKICEREISKCEWMHIDKYLALPNITETNKVIAQCYKDYRKKRYCLRPQENVYQCVNVDNANEGSNYNRPFWLLMCFIFPIILGCYFVYQP